MKKILLALALVAILLSLASCELIESFNPSLDLSEDGNKDDGGGGGGLSDEPDIKEESPQPKETVSVGGLTFNLAANRKAYILTKASAGHWEYTVPASVEGLPVTEIASGAFKNHTELRSVALPDSLELINQGIFEGCKNLESLKLPFISRKNQVNGDNTCCIGYFFNTERPSGGADGWTSSRAGSRDTFIEYWVPNSLTHISVMGGTLGEWSFSGAQVVEVYLGSGIRFISTRVFYDRQKLERVVCENPIGSVGVEAFKNCYNLKHFEINGEASWIGKEAFENCHDLEWIILSAGTSSIGNLAFDDCESLMAIYYLGTPEDYAKIEIGPNNAELEQTTIYFYSENEPETDGNYWRYDGDGVPVVWGE